jgi:hypothetical protein
MADVTALSIISWLRSFRDLRRRRQTKPRMMQMMSEPPAVPAPMPTCAPLLSPFFGLSWLGMDWVPTSSVPPAPPVLWSRVTVVLAVVVCAALITEVSVRQAVVETVDVACAETVDTTVRVDVVETVTVLIVYVYVDV